MATATVSYSASNDVPLGEKRQKTVTFYGTIAFSAAGDAYAAGGLLGLAGAALLNLGPYADRDPLSARIYSLSGSGLGYEYVNSTKKLKILGGGGSGTAAQVEITDGTALNATTPQIATDVVAFEITFPAK